MLCVDLQINEEIKENIFVEKISAEYFSLLGGFHASR